MAKIDKECLELALRSGHEARAMYRQLEQMLDKGWSGTYADLAKHIGLRLKGTHAIKQYVSAYVLDHPNWPQERVFEKASSLHAA